LNSPNQILTAAQMRAGEERLISAGISVDALMERAGQGAAQWIYRMAGGKRVTVLCGPGNNGGDGYVIARSLQERGLDVAVIAPMSPQTSAAKNACAAWGGAPVEDARGGVFVDCLFGTGLSRSLDDDLVARLNALCDAHDFCVAVDMPSGIDSDSGEMLNAGLPAYDLTLALGAWKFAHWQMPAMERLGAQRLVDIGVEPIEGAAILAGRPRLCPPPRDAHKYTRGLLAVIGGEMPGASLLASRAAMHGGAGYVKLFADAQPANCPPDLVVETGGTAVLASDQRIAAALIGPGLGRNEGALGQVAWTLACDLPMVVDADALSLLTPDMLEARSSPIILTPHAGEMKALGNAFGTVGLDRIEQVAELAEAVEGVVVAKGPDTVIAAASHAPVIVPPAPSWLSTAGTGDVLAGLIASQLALGNGTALEAAIAGCMLHREAAILAGPAFSAGDLIDYLPEAYRTFL